MKRNFSLLIIFLTLSVTTDAQLSRFAHFGLYKYVFIENNATIPNQVHLLPDSMQATGYWNGIATPDSSATFEYYADGTIKRMESTSRSFWRTVTDIDSTFLNMRIQAVTIQNNDFVFDEKINVGAGYVIRSKEMQGHQSRYTAIDSFVYEGLPQQPSRIASYFKSETNPYNLVQEYSAMNYQPNGELFSYNYLNAISQRTYQVDSQEWQLGSLPVLEYYDLLIDFSWLESPWWIFRPMIQPSPTKFLIREGTKITRSDFTVLNPQTAEIEFLVTDTVTGNTGSTKKVVYATSPSEITYTEYQRQPFSTWQVADFNIQRFGSDSLPTYYSTRWNHTDSIVYEYFDNIITRINIYRLFTGHANYVLFKKFEFFRNGIALGADEQASKPLVFKLYPNPVAHQLRIELAEQQETTRVEVYNLQNQKLMEIPMSPGQLAVDIDVSSLPAAMYLVRVSQGKRSVHSRFIKN